MCLSSVMYLRADAVGSKSECKLRGEWSPNPATTLMEIDHEIISTAILSLPLIQERQLVVTGESMCT